MIRREPLWAGKTGFDGHFRRIMIGNHRWVLGMLVSYFLPPFLGAFLYVNIFVDEEIVKAEVIRRGER